MFSSYKSQARRQWINSSKLNNWQEGVEPRFEATARTWELTHSIDPHKAITHERLAQALASSTTLNDNTITQLKLDTIYMDEHIKVGTSYYKPSTPKLTSTTKEVGTEFAKLYQMLFAKKNTNTTEANRLLDHLAKKKYSNPQRKH